MGQVDQAAGHVRADHDGRGDPRPPVHDAVRRRGATHGDAYTRPGANAMSDVHREHGLVARLESCRSAPSVQSRGGGHQRLVVLVLEHRRDARIRRPSRVEPHARVEGARPALVQDRLALAVLVLPPAPRGSPRCRRRCGRPRRWRGVLAAGRRSSGPRRLAATSPGSPMRTTSPRSSSTARWQKRRTAAMSCVTKRIVLPSSRSRLKTSKHFCWKPTSPTASTSSISRMSASTWTITEKASRTCIPDE